jgi:hypothetical protein
MSPGLGVRFSPLRGRAEIMIVIKRCAVCTSELYLIDVGKGTGSYIYIYYAKLNLKRNSNDLGKGLREGVQRCLHQLGGCKLQPWGRQLCFWFVWMVGEGGSNLHFESLRPLIMLGGMSGAGGEGEGLTVRVAESIVGRAINTKEVLIIGGSRHN